MVENKARNMCDEVLIYCLMLEKIFLVMVRVRGLTVMNLYDTHPLATY
jgi:hypothetical protein